MAKKWTHEEYVTEIAMINPNIEVVEEYIKSMVPILHKCNICGYEWNARPNNIVKGHGCPVCSGQAIGMAPEYKNSIWASGYKEYFSQFLTEEQMKSIMPKSSKKIKVKCPDCGSSKFIQPNALLSNGLGCKCGDGHSYPNKFIYSFLEQLNIEYIPEYSPNWAVSKRYDIFIPSLNCIIENHGKQHYTGWGNNKDDLTKQKLNDEQKYNIAKLNGILMYVILDCRKSETEWIKSSVMNSILPNVLKFKECEIDWAKCSSDATKNKVKEICEFYKMNKISTKLLAEKFKLDQTSIINYLKKGNEIGWCVFDPKENIKEAAKENGKKTAKSVFQYALDGTFIKEWKCGAAEAERELGITRTSISFCCNGRYESAGGFLWSHDYVSKMSPYNYPSLKSVRCVETNNIYQSIAIATKETGIFHIDAVCKGDRKTAGGYHWEYVNGAEQRRNKKQSEEAKKKRSEALKGKGIKAVRCIETNKVYESAICAQNETGIGRSNISMACNGRLKTAGGYHWEFVNE